MEGIEARNSIAWIEKRIYERRFRKYTLGRSLPYGFDCYLRIFNHFEHQDGTGVTWEEVAEMAGVTFHAEIPESDLWPVTRQGAVEGGFSDDFLTIRRGGLDRETATALGRALDVWSEGEPVFMYFGLTESVHGHEPVLLKKSASELATIQVHADLDAPGWEGPPEWVWPADRRWVLSIDYDLYTHYLCCDEDLGSTILHLDGVEVLRTDLNRNSRYRVL
jgi:hypothetical protein